MGIRLLGSLWGRRRKEGEAVRDVPANCFGETVHGQQDIHTVLILDPARRVLAIGNGYTLNVVEDGRARVARVFLRNGIIVETMVSTVSKPDAGIVLSSLDFWASDTVILLHGFSIISNEHIADAA